MLTHDTHINMISPGDTIEHNGVITTVCAHDIKGDSFMGVTLFGDSYHLGHKPVKKVSYKGVNDSKGSR